MELRKMYFAAVGLDSETDKWKLFQGVAAYKLVSNGAVADIYTDLKMGGKTVEIIAPMGGELPKSISIEEVSFGFGVTKETALVDLITEMINCGRFKEITGKENEEDV